MFDFRISSHNIDIILVFNVLHQPVFFMAMMGDFTCEFMYTKRMFQWQVDDLSYYSTLSTLCSNLGSLVVTPLLHHFNVNDNLIILLSCASALGSRAFKGLARTSTVFIINTAFCVSGLFWAPFR